MTKTRATLMFLLLAAVVTGLMLGFAGAAPPPTDEATIEEFIPSEELPSDSAVAFPVDI